ncbi:unnamed protein product [Rhizophagus irregularis]|uniref:BAH domain-containing protein n=1 Tax=Rhizophagus irregularis TaxID=588596 RepID=A0A916EFZ4_9GLOM|nr:unnamed protein product [Rhizophagus irregularis]
MVKITYKKKDANLRQVIRPKFDKNANLRKNVHLFAKHATNIVITTQNDFNRYQYSLSQSFKTNSTSDESHNLNLQYDNILDNNIHNITQIINHNLSISDINEENQENRSDQEDEINQENEDQENYSWESDNEDQENYSWESNNEDQENYSWESDYEDQENYFWESDYEEDDDLSFEFKNQYDVLQNTPTYYGETKPYFPNKTVMMMFIWYTKYMIGSHAYQDLAKIIRHPDFHALDLPLSITTLKQMRRGLPLMTLNSHNIKINPKDTPSTSPFLKEGYTFSIIDHIERLLNNPLIYPKLYFGPGVETSERSELWHGQVWKESPLFGETEYRIGNVLYKAGDFVLYYTKEMTEQRLGQINGIVIPKENSKQHLLYIQKIIYYEDLPGNIKSFNRQNQSNNHNTVWLTEKREIISVDDIITHVNIWLEDLPEPVNYDYRIKEILYTHNNQQKIRQIQKRHRLPCYSFQKPPGLRHLKYCHITDLQYQEIKHAITRSAKKNLAKKYGLCLEKNILDHLIRNRHVQTPQDPFHCLAGLVRRLLDETFNSMNCEGHSEFIKEWRVFEVPSIWNRLQNPITHRDSYWMNDSLRLAMIIPYILTRAINHRHYKAEVLTRIKNDCLLSSQVQVPGIIVNCWVKMAKACKYVFKTPYVVNTDYNDYTILRKIFERAIVALLKVFGTVFSKLPNIHALRHLPDIAANFGTLINTSVSIKEAVHGLYKRFVPHTNKKDISMDLSKRDNTLQTLRYLLDGGLDMRYNKIDLFAKITYDERLHNLLDNWYISDIVEDNTAESCSDIFSIHPDFQDIQVRGLWKLNKIREQNLPSVLSAENFLTDLTRIYIDIYQNSGAIIQRHVDYYSSIRFTVKNGDVYSNITLRIGEAIDVENVDDPNGRSYALIRAIMIHQDDFRRNNPFLLIDWFYEKGSADSVTGFPIYGLQESDDHSWFHLYPLIIVDRKPKVHFVHKCTARCSNGSHDKNNEEYILNEFYYSIL